MKKLILSPYLIYPLLICGVILDEFYGMEWAGNLTLFAVYFLCVLTAFALFVESSDLFSKASSNNLKMTLSGLLVLAMIISGWIVTAVIFGFSWSALLIKRQIYIDGLKAN